MLVHCAAGVSRSASVVIAYVMRQRNLPFAEARARVKVGRSGRGPGGTTTGSSRYICTASPGTDPGGITAAALGPRREEGGP